MKKYLLAGLFMVVLSNCQNCQKDSTTNAEVLEKQTKLIAVNQNMLDSSKRFPNLYQILKRMHAGEELDIKYIIHKQDKESTLNILEEISLTKNNEIMKLFLENGLNPNQLIEKPNRTKTTILHDAITSGDLPLIDLLLEYKADPNMKDSSGATPLINLCKSPLGSNLLNKNIFDLLVLKGAEINTQDLEGNPALHYALVNKNQTLINKLTDKKAAQNIKESKKIHPGSKEKSEKILFGDESSNSSEEYSGGDFATPVQGSEDEREYKESNSFAEKNTSAENRLLEALDKDNSLTSQENLELKKLILPVKDKLKNNITTDEAQFLTAMAEITQEVILSGKQGLESEKLAQQLGRQKLTGVWSEKQAKNRYEKIIGKVLTQNEINKLGIGFEADHKNSEHKISAKLTERISKDLKTSVLEWVIDILQQKLYEEQV